MTIKLDLDIQVAKALQGLASVIAKEQQYDDALLKTVGITREQARANAELVKQHQLSHDLAVAFKKHEASLAEEQIRQDKRRADQFVANRTRERQEWSRFISELKQLNTTPQQEFEARQDKLNKALAAGAIDQKLFNAEIGRMRAELEPAAGAAGGLVSTLMQGGVVAQVWSQAAKALELVKQRLQETQAEAQKALGQSKTQADFDKEFLAISSGGTPEQDAAEVNRRIQQAQGMSLKFGMPLEMSKRVILESANYGLGDADTESVAKFSKLTGAPENAAAMVGQYKTSFTKEKLTGDQVNAMVLGLAKHGPSQPADYAKFLPPALIAGGGIGLESLDVGAAYSVASTKMGRERGADRMALLISRLSDKDAGDTFKGKSIMESARILRGSFEGDRELFDKVVGERMEAKQAMFALTGDDSQQLYDAAAADARAEMAKAGTAADPLTQKLAAGALIPSIRDSSAVTRSDVRRQIAEQRLAPREARSESSRNYAKAALLDQQGLIGPIRQGAYGLMDSLFKFTGYDGSPVSPELIGLASTAAGPARGAGASIFNPIGNPAAIGSQARNALGASSQYISESESKELAVLKQIRDLLTGVRGKANSGAARAQATVPVE